MTGIAIGKREDAELNMPNQSEMVKTNLRSI